VHKDVEVIWGGDLGDTREIRERMGRDLRRGSKGGE